MRVSQYVLQRLSEVGIDTAFTVYGGAISEMMDAFTRQTAVKYVVTIHEQAAGFAAEGYAKAKGVPGCAIVTSGPGGGNLITAIQDCYYDSTPAIFITGQVQSRFMRREGERQLGFQESPLAEIAAPITKYAKCVKHASDIRIVMDIALRECMSGRRGPVLIDLPIDVQKTEIDPSKLPSIGGSLRKYDSPTEAGREFVKDLSKANRPAILVGGGARDGADDIVRFAEIHGIPCFRTWNALDVVTDDSPAYSGTIGTYGGPGRNFGIQNCDLLLSLGCRMSGRITGGLPETFARGAKIYMVDVDESVLDPKLQQVKAHVNVLARAEDFINEIAANGGYFRDWLDLCRAWLGKYDPVTPAMMKLETMHHYAFMRRMSQRLPANAIVVSDTGGNVIMMGHCFQSKRGQRIFTSNGNTPMGFSMCGAIGAWFADTSRPIICIIGDGGMQMNIQELQTIVKYNIPLKVFIINNGILGNTKSYQRVNKMAEVACGPDGYSAPDFSSVADAYGIHSSEILKPEAIDRAISHCLSLHGAHICDVQHFDFCQYEPRISDWDVGIEDAFPFLPRDEFRANMIIDPLPGWEKKQ